MPTDPFDTGPIEAGGKILNFTSNYLPDPALLGMLVDARNPYRDDLAPLTQVLQVRDCFASGPPDEEALAQDGKEARNGSLRQDEVQPQGGGRGAKLRFHAGLFGLFD